MQTFFVGKHQWCFWPSSNHGIPPANRMIPLYKRLTTYSSYLRNATLVLGGDDMKVLLPFACGLLSLFSVNLLPAIEGQDKSSLQRPIQSPKNEDKVEINARQQQALLMLES